MATFICPTTPVDVWFALDPTIPELPLAPAITTNSDAQPANTYSGSVADADFALLSADWSKITREVCDSFTWGLITGAVTSSDDYGTLQTIWDLLPTDSPAIPVEEIPFDAVYPPYREITTQAFPVVLAAEVTRINKVRADLDLDPFELFVRARIDRPLLRDVTAAIEVTATVEQLGGNLVLPLRTRVFIDSTPAPIRVGFETGLIAWRDGAFPPEQDFVAVTRVKATVSASSVTVDAPITVAATVEGPGALGMSFGIEVI
jgi:hypothetical protein